MLNVCSAISEERHSLLSLFIFESAFLITVVFFPIEKKINNFGQTLINF